MQMGPPCACGYPAVISASLDICNAGMGFIETTMLPVKDPADRHFKLVRYMGTFFPCSAERSGMPAFNSAPSYEKLQPMRKATELVGQQSVTSVVSRSSLPSRYMAYLVELFNREREREGKIEKYQTLCFDLACATHNKE